MSYVQIVSWHAIEVVDAAGWHTRCGRLITTQSAPVSPTLPLDERSCETCLRLDTHDAEVENDTVAG